MRILFVTTVHNSLGQRLQGELTNRGHGVAIHLAIGDGRWRCREGAPARSHCRADAEAAIPREVWDHHTRHLLIYTTQIWPERMKHLTLSLPTVGGR